VFDVAKAPAAQNNGFGTFGVCGCSDGVLSYNIDVTFTDPSLSGVPPFTGSFVIRNSAGNPILTAGAVATFQFVITNNGSGVTITLGGAVVSPAVILDFIQSGDKQSRSFYALVDKSTLYA